MEGKLQFHSHLTRKTLIAELLLPCWTQFYLPSWKMIQWCLGSSLVFFPPQHRWPGSARLHSEWLLQASCTILHLVSSYASNPNSASSDTAQLPQFLSQESGKISRKEVLLPARASSLPTQPRSEHTFFFNLSWSNSLFRDFTTYEERLRSEEQLAFLYFTTSLPFAHSVLTTLPPSTHLSRTLSDFTFTFHFHALEKEMATHSSVLAWRIPGTGAPGGLPSLWSHRVRHDWSDLAAAAAGLLLQDITWLLSPRSLELSPLFCSFTIFPVISAFIIVPSSYRYCRCYSSAC